MNDTAERFDRIRSAEPEVLKAEDRELREVWDLLGEIPGDSSGSAVSAPTVPSVPTAPSSAGGARWIYAVAAILAVLAIGVGWMTGRGGGRGLVEEPGKRGAGAAERVRLLQGLESTAAQAQALRLLREDPNPNVRLAALDVLQNERAMETASSTAPWIEPLGNILQAEGSPHVQIPLLAHVEPEALRFFLKRSDLDDTAREIAETRLKNQAASEL